MSLSLLKMNEEAKRSMVEWQEKLDRVTKDSEERISELRQKLAKVRKESCIELDSALLDSPYKPGGFSWASSP